MTDLLMHQNHLTTLDLAVFCGCPLLQWLYLGTDVEPLELVDEHNSSHCALQNLVRIDAYSVRTVHTFGIIHFFKNSHLMESIYIKDGDVMEITQNIFFPFSNLSALTFDTNPIHYLMFNPPETHFQDTIEFHLHDN